MIKRTPPNSPAPSDNNLSASIASFDSSNVTIRRNNTLDQQQSSLMMEMRKMFEDLKQQQESRFASISSQIKSQNTEIQKSIEFMSQKYDEAVGKLESLQVDFDKSQEYVKTLENKVDLLEKNARITTVELRNIPKSPTENKATLYNYVKKAGEKLSFKITDLDIKSVYRTRNKNTTPGPIIAEFTTTSTKDNLIKYAREYNKQNSNNKLNTTHLDVAGPSRPVYISEHLTYKASRLYFLARELAKDLNFSYCWTMNGQVYLRKKDGAPIIRINNESDILKLRSEK